jgi:DNA-binding IclR family transcriptional regulator
MPQYFPRSTDHSIFELLEAHESLAYEKIAAHLNENRDAVGFMLQSLRTRGLVEALVFDQPAERVVEFGQASARTKETERLAADHVLDRATRLTQVSSRRSASYPQGPPR